MSLQKLISLSLGWLIACIALAEPPPHDAGRVVIVRNESSAVSRAVAEDYAQRRGVPHVVSVRCQDSAVNPGLETVTFAVFQESLEKPLRDFLSGHPSIDFIVLTKGIPLRIADAPGLGLGERRPSLDSYLAALDYDKVPDAVRLHLSDSGFDGTAWANRFWNSRDQFAHAKFGGYLVTRLDGYTDEPLLQAVASPSILWERYTRGWTLAESYYAASRFVGWEDIVIGDPLCRPYPCRGE
jgi:hypothetical protein